MQKMICLLLVGLFYACQPKVSTTQRQHTPLIKDKLTADLSKIHQRGFINGFSVAIVNKKETLYQNGFGYANLKAKEKYTQKTIQNIGSVSKTLIGIALLKAQEMGKLTLDDPINNYLPFRVDNPYHPEEPITIRHLATHTGTIVDTDHYDGKAYVLKEEDSKTNPILKDLPEKFHPPAAKEPLLNFLKKILSPKGEWYQKEGFLKDKPGEIFEYSNFGSTLAAAVLEIAVGQAYDEFTTKYILQPLEMAASGWSFNSIDLADHTRLYANTTDEIPFYSLITYPDGGLITSVEDLGKYLTELIKGYTGEGLLLQKDSYRTLFEQQLDDSNFLDRDKSNAFDDEYNSGIFMGFTPKGFIGHIGGDPGISTYMFFNPQTQTGRILMINTSIINSGGVKEFFAIWKTLGKYEAKLSL